MELACGNVGRTSLLGCRNCFAGALQGCLPVSRTLQHRAGKLTKEPHALLRQRHTLVSSHGPLLMAMRRAEPPACPAFRPQLSFSLTVHAYLAFLLRLFAGRTVHGCGAVCVIRPSQPPATHLDVCMVSNVAAGEMGACGRRQCVEVSPWVCMVGGAAARTTRGAG